MPGNVVYRFRKNGTYPDQIIEPSNPQVSKTAFTKAFSAMNDMPKLVGFTFIADYDGFKQHIKISIICPFEDFNKTLKWIKHKISKCSPPPSKEVYTDFMTGTFTEEKIAGWIDSESKFLIFVDQELFDWIGKNLGIYDTY